MKVKYCPKCNSIDIGIDITAGAAFGAPQKWKCQNCGFELYSIFPEKEIEDIKLLLTSDGLSSKKIKKAFLKLINKPIENIKILFMTTASNHEKDKSWLDRDREDLFKLGIKKENLLEFDLDKKQTLPKEFEVILIEGGNTYYLLKRIRETGFDKKITELVKSGILYLGISAGSILAGPNIRISIDEGDYGVTDSTGLSLTEMIICPHITRKNKSIIKDYEKKYNQKVTPIKDGEALLIINNKSKLIW